MLAGEYLRVVKKSDKMALIPQGFGGEKSD